MLLGIPDYGTFFVAALLIVLLPGPNSMFVVSEAARNGVRRGWAAALGVFVGDSVLMGLTFLGAASLLQGNPVVFSVVKYLGAAYLAWIGFRLVRAGIAAFGQQQPATAEETVAPPRRGGSFLTALVLSLLNPKAILFFVAFFVQFLRPDSARPLLDFLVLATTMQVLSMIYLGLLIVGGTALARGFSRHRRTSGGLTGLVGTVFVGFGVKLAAASL
ncbi:L-lysine permease [Serinicoccus hydrothermalis]|uniref:L-lysine permease n=1 Tax=Serinicoccus hydrothermalis TaxID=1758689 RepID=A0A1B1NEB6_9MICO|nr:leucine efflux protein LeuE [Serinicoccus hydrothermalis]ANS79764.1 L-lysine permease [Serinicoccus hydrothermalis]